MSCQTCIKASELFDSLAITDEWQSCEKKTARVNRALRNFYLDTISLPINMVSHRIANSWLQTIITEYPIYKVMGFFSSCGLNCSTSMNNACCGEWTQAIQMSRVNNNPQTWQYIVDCETQINSNIPNWHSDMYLLYSRWPKFITTMQDDVCIDSYMLSWLEYYIERFYHSYQWDINRYNMAKWEYSERLNNAKEAAAWRTFIINWWAWASVRPS